jgi:hypothetical protein
MVTFYFDDATAKVWYDDSIQCLFTKVHRTLTSADLELLSKTVCNAVKRLNRQHRGSLFSVTDLQSCENWSVDMIKDLMIHVISAEYKAGIARKFFLRPINISSRNALVQGLLSLPNMNTSVHDHQRDVIFEIEQIRSTGDAESLRSKSAGRPFQRFIQRFTKVRS